MTQPAPGRVSPLDLLDVIVLDDAVVAANLAGDVLVLRRGQIHEHAVQRLSRLFEGTPGVDPDSIQRLVRKYLPDAPSLDDLSVQLDAVTPDWIQGQKPPPEPESRKSRLWLIAGAVTATVAAVSLGVYGVLSRMNETPFGKPEFTALTRVAGFQCTELSDSAAECRNVAEGTVWKVTAFEGVGKDPTSFRFSHGNELAVVWVFDTPEDREEFPQLRAYERLYPYLSSRDRVIVGSTDAPLLVDLAGAVDQSILEQSNRGRSTGAPGRATSSVESWPSVPATPIVPWPSARVTTRAPETARPSSDAAAEQSAPVGKPAGKPAATGTPEPTSPAQAPAADDPPVESSQDPVSATQGPAEAGSDESVPRLSVTIPLPEIGIGL